MLRIRALIVVSVLGYSAVGDQQKSDAKPADFPMCEDKELSEADKTEMAELKKKVPVPFTEEELKIGFAELGYKKDDKAACQEHPQAFWIMGASASGKSTVTRALHDFADCDACTHLAGSVVVIDGDVLREHHASYQQLIQFGRKHDCIVKDAWPLLRDHLKAGKAELLAGATDPNCKRHMEVPETCTSWERCAKDMEKLKKEGYTINVIAVYGPREGITERGVKRAQNSGKAYSTKKFPMAIAAFVPIMAHGNGECFLVNNTVLPPNVSVHHKCPNQAEYDPDKLPEYLEAVETEAIGGSHIELEEYRAAQKKMKVPLRTTPIVADDKEKAAEKEEYEHTGDWFLRFAGLAVLLAVCGGVAVMFNQKKPQTDARSVELGSR